MVQQHLSWAATWQSRPRSRPVDQLPSLASDLPSHCNVGSQLSLADTARPAGLCPCPAGYVIVLGSLLPSPGKAVCHAAPGQLSSAQRCKRVQEKREGKLQKLYILQHI